MLSTETLNHLKAADPDRCRAAVFAPKQARDHLYLLYAFHHELAKVPEIVSEPMLGDIRYQWWRDVLDEIYAGGIVRKHEVTTPLANLFREIDMPRFWADQLIDGRVRDLDSQPFTDLSAAKDYCRQTSGMLMQMAVFILGEEPGEAVLKAGEAWGLTGLARAWGYYHKSMLSQLDYEEICQAASKVHKEASQGLRDLSPHAAPAVVYAALVPHYIKRLTHTRHNPTETLVQYGPIAKRVHLLDAVLRGRV